ncbi:MAG: protein-glutamate O-methyltransferase CheR [Verrucomicrobia bacterium]|nr:MAG: protein-glutamate O-methyltransferase CheR [Verrucomicrobiota bacterium]
MPLPPADLDYVRKLVFDHSGIVLERSKAYLVETRLTPVATRLGFKSLEEFVRNLKNTPVNGAHRTVIDAMTTNETYFFRDIHPFEALRKNVLPEIIQNRESTRTLRIWCGACSTGQEPYSISIILKDGFPKIDNWNIQIVATDLSQDVLEKAKSGAYTQLEVNRGLPAMYLVKYFKQQQDRWVIREDIRKRVQFRELNLTKPFPPMGRFDIVFLRNVLIYFDNPTKQQILGRIQSLLAPDGYLFLGCAETPVNLNPNFEAVSFGKATCYRLKR